MMRREFIALLSSAALAWPCAARAQLPIRMQHIGMLVGSADNAEGQSRVGAFREALQAQSWIEGRNVQIDLRWGALTLLRIVGALSAPTSMALTCRVEEPSTASLADIP